jgi:hypothetical protein
VNLTLQKKSSIACSYVLSAGQFDYVAIEDQNTSVGFLKLVEGSAQK